VEHSIVLHVLIQEIQRLYCGIHSALPPIRLRLADLSKNAQQKNNIAVLDGVRAIACLIVMSYHISLMGNDTHLWDPFSLSHPLFASVVYAGAMGVTLFFVLSGFLLFMPYAKALLSDKANWPSAWSFYLRRAFRIIPAYYACLFLLIFLSHPEYLQPARWADLGLFLTFFMESGPSTYQKINGPFWTLGVEWQFYMLLPLMALGMIFLVRRVSIYGSTKRRLWLVIYCLSGVIAWGLFTRVWRYYFLTHPAETFLVPRPVMDGILFFVHGMYGKFLEDFAIGMLISLLFVYARQVPAESAFKRHTLRLSPRLWSAGILLLVVMSAWRFIAKHPGRPFLQPLMSSYYWLSELGFSLGFGLCIFALLFGDSAVLRRPFEWLPLRWIGLISFSLYMWHLPLLIFFRYNIANHLQGWDPAAAFSLYWLWAFLVIIPFSALSYLLIEKPGMAFGERLRQRLERKRDLDKQVWSPGPAPVEESPREPVTARR
jgi:peptidoglycan/LPS O-acetylase OafA/YrhL